MNDHFVFEALSKLSERNDGIITPILISKTGSHLFKTNIENSDRDYDALWVVNSDRLNKIVAQIPDSARLYFGLDKFNDILRKDLSLSDLILKFSMHGSVSCSSKIDKSICSLPIDNAKPDEGNNHLDIVLHSSFQVADSFLDDRLPPVREQMFLLALTQKENQLLGANHQMLEPLRDHVADFILSSPDFHRALNKYWDKWWRLIANPNGGFNSSDAGMVSDLDFSCRTDMIHSLDVYSDKGHHTFDVKNSALLLSAVQGWISLYNSYESRRWSINDIDSEYIRDLKRGRISYSDFAPVRNKNLERLRGLTAKIASPKTRIQWVLDFFRIVEGIEKLKLN